jgi:hypothetical protein
MGSYYVLKGHSASSQIGIILVESIQNQMVLKMIRWGRLVRQSRSSQEAKSLKTRVKGTVQPLYQWGSIRGSKTGGQWAE